MVVKNARFWARTFTALAIVATAGTLARSFWVDRNLVSSPCTELASVLAPTAVPAPTVVDFAPKMIGLGSPLCVAIAGAANLAAERNGKPILHLFLNGLELKGSTGAFVDREKNLVLFDVARTAEDADVWRNVIGQPGWGTDGAAAGSALVRIGAGYDSGEFGRDAIASLQLRIVDPWALIFGLAAFIAAVFALAFASRDSVILRDGDAASTYSLGRVQMAFWLYLITAAFVYIWLVTGDYNGIVTTQALALLGISGTTGLMAIAAKNPAAPDPSTGFWNDILSDGGGWALHRLQIAVWTAILGVVFVAEIYHSLRLPAFDSNLLILMGISGLTYVGFKFNEK